MQECMCGPDRLQAGNPTTSFGRDIMKARILVILVTALLAACASRVPEPAAPGAPAALPGAPLPLSPPYSNAAGLDEYKREVALYISHRNPERIYEGRPQALLRSVVVLRFVVDAHGHLLHSEVLRSNHDRQTVTAALASLRESAPLPPPPRHLLHRGRVEVAETWLFDDDGRFQLRSIAQAQMNQ